MNAVFNLLMRPDAPPIGSQGSGPVAPSKEEPAASGSGETSFDAILAMIQAGGLIPVPVAGQAQITETVGNSSEGNSSEGNFSEGNFSEGNSAAPAAVALKLEITAQGPSAQAPPIQHPFGLTGGWSPLIPGPGTAPVELAPGFEKQTQPSGEKQPVIQAAVQGLLPADHAPPGVPANPEGTHPETIGAEPAGPLSRSGGFGAHHAFRTAATSPEDPATAPEDPATAGAPAETKSGPAVRTEAGGGGSGRPSHQETASGDREQFSQSLFNSPATGAQREVFTVQGAKADEGPQVRDPFRVVDQLVKALENHKASLGSGGAKEIEIRLHPEHLGRVNLKLSLEEGVLSARITVASASAREAVDQGLSQLRQSLGQHGYQVGSLDVNFGGASPFWRDHRQDRPQEQRLWKRGYESIVPSPVTQAAAGINPGGARLLDYIA